jgi:TPP-dependent indolepyruvate ferredoxin oxidoreductase alpha subunit
MEEDFKQRLETERSELEKKLKKLNEFNQSERVNGIDPDQKSLLIIQAGAMYTYLECLKERLARL